MDFEIIERHASALEPLPSGVDVVDTAAYMSMRALYREFRAGIVTREEAKADKTNVQRAYEQGKLLFRAARQDAEIRNSLSHVFCEMNKSDCPLCQRAAKIYDGRKKE